MKQLRSLVLAIVLFLSGCALFSKGVKPAKVAASLADCELTASSSVQEWEACCEDVLRRYPLSDGGARDPDLCKVK